MKASLALAKAHIVHGSTWRWKSKNWKKKKKKPQTNIKTKKEEKKVLNAHSYLCIGSSPMILQMMATPNN